MGRRSTTAMLLAVGVLLAMPAIGSAHTLSYARARTVAQRKADRFAGQRTDLNALQRRTKHRFFASARWVRIIQVPCPMCGFDPITGNVYDTTTPMTSFCTAQLSVWYPFPHRRTVRARVTGHFCS